MLHRLAAWMSAVALLAPAVAGATPSSTFWTTATPSVEPFGSVHLTYDTYFGRRGSFPVDVGLTAGVLPWKRLQLELGFDLAYPTDSGGDTVAFPLVLNAKVGAPEDVYFEGQPGWSLGIFGVGFEDDVNDAHVLHAIVGKTFPWVGTLALGGYYGLDEGTLRSPDGDSRRAGVMASWTSPKLDAPAVDGLVLVWDAQSGENVLGGTSGAVYVYLTPGIDVGMGPVLFFEPELQPGRSRWMWSVQLDADVELAADSS